jgi:hypothetical protein
LAAENDHGGSPNAQTGWFARFLLQKICCLLSQISLINTLSKVSIGRMSAVDFPKFTFPARFSEGFQPSDNN